MGYDTQMAVAGVMVALAAGYVIRAAWKTWAGRKAGCGPACGKCATPAPPEQKGRFPLPQA